MFSLLLTSSLVLAFCLDQPAGDAPRANDEALDASYVNISFEAVEALRKARERIERGDWSGAAAAYHEIATKYADYVMPDGRRRFVGVQRYIHLEIAQWPPEGLAAYRTSVDRTASTALEQAQARRDSSALLSVAQLYFATRHGAAAQDAAGELAMESGDFEAARQWYEELLTLHPDRGEFDAQWRAKAAMCEAWQGDAGALRKLAGDFENSKLPVVVRWGGIERPIGRFASDMLAELDAQQPATTQSKYASVDAFCGGPNRRAFFSTNASAEASLWRCRVFHADDDATDRDMHAENGADFELYLRSVRSGRWLTSMPVYADERVFICDGRSVCCIETNRPEQLAWRYSSGEAARAPRPWISEDEPPEQHTLLHADGRIYAHLTREPAGADDDAARRASMLVCIDAATGQLIWKNELAGLASRFEELSLDGAPILHRGRLLTIARRRKGFGFEACLLVCFDPKTGKLLYSTHVGEAATGSYGYTHPTRSYVAAQGDRVFVHSNLGTIAAISASTGRTVWLRTYSSRYADATEAAWPTRFGQPIRSWQYQPAMIWRDTVVCAPMDMDAMLILDQATGETKRTVPLERLFNPECFLGIDGDRLLSVGGQVVCYDLARDEIAWQRPLAEGRIFGRGAVSTTGVYVPTTTALLRYALDGGPAAVHRWSIEHAGNILPTADQIIVASADYVSGLVSRDEAFSRLDRRMSDHPADVFAALSMAELAFSVGEDERGLRAVEEAAARVIKLKPTAAKDAVDAAPDQGKASAVEASARQALFDRLLRFAAMIESAASPTDSTPRTAPDSPSDVRNARIAIAARLLESADRSAPDEPARAVARMLLARTRLVQGSPAQAAALYQSMLSQAELRGLRLRATARFSPHGLINGEAVEVEQETSVYLLAEEWIELLIQRFGHDVYAAIEESASKRLERARDANGTADLLKIAAEFPNSRTASEALVLHARRCLRDGDRQAAVQSLRLALCRPTPRLAEAIRLISEALVAMGETSEARLWLERGVRLHPTLRFGGENGANGFADLLAALPRDIAEASEKWPTVSGSVAPAYHRLFNERVTVLASNDAVTWPGPWDVLLTHASGRIEARSPINGRNLWSGSAESRGLPLFLGAGPDHYYFAAAHHLFALTRTSGQPAWRYGDEPKDEPSGDPEDIESWTDHVRTQKYTISASDRGDVVCIDSTVGALRWRRSLDGGTASHLTADERFVYCAKWRGRSNRIYVLDLESGALLREIPCEDSRPIQLLRPASNGALLVLLARCAMSVDPSKGEVRWSRATARHYLVSTYIPDVDGFIICDDGRSLVKIDDDTGRTLWRTEPIGEDHRDGLWTALVDDRIVAASRDALRAFDAADGRALWTAEQAAGLRLQSPLVTSDSLISIREEVGPAAPAPGDDILPRSVRYRISRVSLADGAEIPLTNDGPLITEPLASFGGLFIRNRALIVLDGERLIGYVGQE